MGELKLHRSHHSTVTLKVNGNPEGKGSSGFLLDWYRTEPRGVVAKPQRQILAEFFTSMLVLSAEFKYKPAIGVPNYLYWINDEWSLSLIAPQEWSEERRAGFACKCLLQPDMTWTIEPSELLAEKNAVSDAVGRFYDSFAETLNSDLTLEENSTFLRQGNALLPTATRKRAQPINSWRGDNWQSNFNAMPRLADKTPATGSRIAGVQRLRRRQC